MPRHLNEVPDATHLLNVDLEVESEHDLSALVRALEPVALSLERPEGRACFELHSAIAPLDVEPLIIEFLRHLAALPPAARAAWDNATQRVFDIGIQSAHQPFQTTYPLSAATLQAIAALGASLAVTVYAPEPSEP